MSWLRNAVNLAVESGARQTLTRTVRSYAGNAVAGARLLLPDRIGARNLLSFRQTVKRLEEVSVSCRGVERVQLLRRWLVALKETEKLTATDGQEKNSDDQLISDDNSDSPKSRPTLIYYVDTDMGDEPKTFRDVFLHSQALEGMTLSMILEEPTQEEVTLLLEIYGLCLTGRREIHGVVMSSVQNLAKANSSYQDEVLIKREELLKLVQNAISGLKLNADLARIDAEACSIREKLDKLMAQQLPLSESCNNSSETGKDATVQKLKAALVEIQLCSKLESLLLKKKSLNNGDSLELHAEKVEKLRVLSESLANSTSQAEKRILDHRYQKEEALNFRVAKATEVGQLEKDLVAEIAELEKQREELQEALKKVIISLNSLHGRLHNAREEREQFDEASNQLIVHLKSKEDELNRSIDSYRAEADVVNTWICFLEDTWVFQASYTEKKEKQVNEELEKYGGYFVKLVIHLLSKYKESSRSSITCIRNLVEKLSSSQGDASSNTSNPRKNTEEEYVDVEAKLLTTLSVVDTMKREFYVQNEGIYRKDDQKVQELFDDLKNIKDEFESIEIPTFVIDASPQKPETPLISPTPASSAPPLSIRNPFSKSIKKQDQKEEPSELYSGIDSDISREGSMELDLTDWVFDAPAKDITINLTNEKTNPPAKDITVASPSIDTSTTPPSKEITPTPTQENTATALAKEITTAPPLENTTAPAKDITTAPAKDITTAPSKDIATASVQENIPTALPKDITTAPDQESTTSASAKEHTTATKEITITASAQEKNTAPSTENTTTAVAKEITTAPPLENKTAPAKDITTAPSKDIATASVQENIPTALPKDITTAPDQESTTSASAKEHTTATKENTITASAQEKNTAPSTENTTTAVAKEITTALSKESISTAPANEAATTAAPVQENSSASSKEITTTSQEFTTTSS